MIEIGFRNAHLVWIYSLRDGITGAAITNATGAGYVNDAKGQRVPGTDFTMTHSASGNYYGTISQTNGVVRGEPYTVVVQMLDSSGNRAYFEIPATVVARDA